MRRCLGQFGAGSGGGMLWGGYVLEKNGDVIVNKSRNVALDKEFK